LCNTIKNKGDRKVVNFWLVKEVLCLGDFQFHRLSAKMQDSNKIELFIIVFKNIEGTSVKIYIFVSVIAHGNQ
jgi:hypothetical protein